MNRGSTSANSIADADALARALYRRSRLAGPEFVDIATVVRGLHTVLKHLRVEAEDPDSLLNTSQQQQSVYARQLGPIVEDCDFTLKQLDTILEKYGGSSADTPSEDGPPRDGYIVGTMESREKDMIALIRTKLANQKTNIDIFLDTVQLHNPTKARQFVDNQNNRQMDSIKDKVDAIAARLARRRAASYGAGDLDDDEELWRQFCTELTREGFSNDVLMRNKEVLRAYLRELDSNGLLDNESPPSVRGLLDHRPAQGPLPRGPPMTVTPTSYPPPTQPPSGRGDLSPKEVVYPATENEKFLPSVKLDRNPPDYSNANSGPPHALMVPYQAPGQISSQPHGQNPPSLAQSQSQNQGPSRNLSQSQLGGHLQTYNPYHPQNIRNLQPPSMPNNSSALSSSLDRQSTPSDSDSVSSTDSGSFICESRNSLALISTRDLMQLDETAGLAQQMSATHLSPQLPAPYQFISPGTSPSTINTNTRYLPALPPASAPAEHVLSSSPSQLSVSPRYVPPLPPPYTSPASMTVATRSPPPAYPNSPTAPQFYQQLPRLYSRLQPDSMGRDIPLDATWTKIRRELVSPEVLSKAGVRYEARPEFVAVLGILTKAQIADFARQTDEVRRLRMGGKGYYPPPRYMRGGSSGGLRSERDRSGSTSDEDSDVLWDESETSSDDEKDQERRRRESRRYRHRDIKAEKEREKESDKDNDKDKEKTGDKDSDDKGTKVYPFILPLSTGNDKASDGKGSPASTVPPKPILKNTNQNHVRFDRDGPIEISPEEMAAEQRRRERKDRERAKDREHRDRERERDRERRRRDRDREPDRLDREREQHRRDRDHAGRDGHRHHHHSSSDRRHRNGDGHSHSAGGDRTSRDRDSRRDKKKAWGETLGAVGIGGAAASLLSVLSEAASGF